MMDENISTVDEVIPFVAAGCGWQFSDRRRQGGNARNRRTEPMPYVTTDIDRRRLAADAAAQRASAIAMAATALGTRLAALIHGDPRPVRLG
jgi:hypothetical protein